MKKKHKITLLVLGILLAMSLMLSSSYALWVFNVSQESTNAVQADCFEITYNDSNPLGLEYAFPITDSMGVQLTPYTFTIKNICNHPADFQINLETLNTSTLDASNIKIDLNGRITSYEDAESITPTLSNASGATKIYEDTIVPTEEKTYNLRLWIKDDAVQNEIENKIYSSKISVKSTVRNKFDVALLMNGYDFISNIRTLSGEIIENPEQLNTTIKHIRISNTAPQENNNAITLSTDESSKPIYGWFDVDTIYLYSEANKIYLNPNSYYLFYGLSVLEDIDLSHFDTSYATKMNSMFGQLKSITSLDVSNFDTSKVTEMDGMFENCELLTELNLSNFDTSKVISMGNMFENCKSLTTLDLSHFDTRNVTDMCAMFLGTGNIRVYDVSSFDTSNVENMSWMFSGYGVDPVATEIIFGPNFDTSKVKDMQWMFERQMNITNLDLGDKYNTSNVENMEGMFNMMLNLTTINLGPNFDTSKVTDMRQMFHKTNIKVLDLGDKFDTSNCTDFNNMFSYSKLETIYSSKDFDISKATTYTSKNGTFGDLPNLVGGAGTTYDANHYNVDYARIDDPENGKPGYFTLKTN